MQVGWAGGARRHRFPVVTLSRLSWRLYLRERALEGRFDSRFDRVDRRRWFRPLAGERDGATRQERVERGMIAAHRLEERELLFDDAGVAVRDRARERVGETFV